MTKNVRFIPYEDDGCFVYIKIVRVEDNFIVYHAGNKYMFKITPEMIHDFEDGNCDLLLSKLFDRMGKS